VAPSTREPVMIPATKHVDVSALDGILRERYSGDVLTARHVVEGCQSLFVIRGAHVARAKVRAVIVCGIRPHRAASFAKTVDLAS
jgi:hypothetical protein